MRTYIRLPQLVFVLFVLPVMPTLTQNTVASEITDEQVKATMLTEATAVACNNPKMLEISRLDDDSCLAQAENVAPYCWGRLLPWLPDLGLANSIGFESKNMHKTLTAISLLKTCIQARILLAEGGNEGARTDGVGEPNRQVDKSRGTLDLGLETDETWIKVIEDARSEFAANPDLFGNVSRALVTDKLLYVVLDNRKGFRAYRKGEGDSLVRVTEGLQDWGEILTARDVGWARNAGTEVALSVGPVSKTDLHYFDVSYVSASDQPFPHCTPDLRHIPCGSCEVDRAGDHRALLTWFIRDTKTRETEQESDGGIESLRASVSTKEQCWKDGMSQFGIDVETP